MLLSLKPLLLFCTPSILFFLSATSSYYTHPPPIIQPHHPPLIPPPLLPSSPSGYYNNVYHCVTSIAKKEGIRAFYLSLTTTLMMNVPYGCIMVAANESARKVLNPSGEYSFTSSMLAGVVNILPFILICFLVDLFVCNAVLLCRDF